MVTGTTTVDQSILQVAWKKHILSFTRFLLASEHHTAKVCSTANLLYIVPLLSSRQVHKETTLYYDMIGKHFLPEMFRFAMYFDPNCTTELVALVVINPRFPFSRHQVAAVSWPCNES